MQILRSSSCLFGALALAAITASHPVAAATSGSNSGIEPSRMIVSGSKVYIFVNGGGIKSSVDGLLWASAGTLPLGASVAALLPNGQGIWSPDVIFLNGLYYVYYSVADTATNCAIGLQTSPTLDSTAPGYAWTDRGVVLSSKSTDKYCTIHPTPVLDKDNNLWLAWGAGYPFPSDASSIWVTRLDNSSGLVSAADTAKPGHPLEIGHKEEPYLYYRNGTYVLFYQTGNCCDGTNSSYVAHMATSSSITGPYTGDRTFLSSAGSVHGPGSLGFASICGVDRLTYSYFPTATSILGENDLSYDTLGLPVLGADSTTPLTTQCSAGGGGAGGAGAGGASGSVAGAPSGGSPAKGGASSGGASAGGAGGKSTGSTSAGATSAGAPSAGGSSTPVDGGGASQLPSGGATHAHSGGTGSPASGGSADGSGGANAGQWGSSRRGHKRADGSPLTVGTPDETTAVESGCAYSRQGPARRPLLDAAFIALSALLLRWRRRPRAGSVRSRG